MLKTVVKQYTCLPYMFQFIQIHSFRIHLNDVRKECVTLYELFLTVCTIYLISGFDVDDVCCFNVHALLVPGT